MALNFQPPPFQPQDPGKDFQLALDNLMNQQIKQKLFQQEIAKNELQMQNLRNEGAMQGLQTAPFGFSPQQVAQNPGAIPAAQRTMGLSAPPSQGLPQGVTVGQTNPLEQGIQRYFSQQAAKRALDERTGLATATEKETQGVENLSRANLLNKQAEMTSKAPAGFRFTTDNNLETIPGGPADIKGQEKARKLEQSKQAFVTKVDRLLEAAKKAKGLVGGMTSGYGSVLAAIPGTSARSLSGFLDTIKANAAFNELQDMRANSPTGGALGNVSDKEASLLQSTIGSLDQGQEAPQLNENIDTVIRFFEKAKNASQGKAQATTEPGKVGRFTVRQK